jgi:hypothetical protein
MKKTESQYPIGGIQPRMGSLNNQYRIGELPPIETVKKEYKVVCLVVLVKQDRAIYNIKRAPIIMVVIIKKIIAVLKMPVPVGVFITRGRAVCNAIVNDSEHYFTVQPVSPTIPIVMGFIDDLEAAEQNIKDGVLGATGDRNAKKVIALDGLKSLLSYVQVKANNDVVNAVSIITSASMFVKGSGTGSKPDLSIKNVKDAMGNLVINAKSLGKGLIYAWEISTDGIAYSAITPTTKCKAILAGQLEGKKIYVRFRTLKNGVYSGYSVVASVIVGA